MPPTRPYNKMFPLPVHATNDRIRQDDFTRLDSALEPGFKLAAQSCERCESHQVWCTYGTGLNNAGRPRGAGTDKCDFCKQGHIKCTLAPGKSTKYSRALDTLQGVSEKLYRLAAKQKDQDLAKALRGCAKKIEAACDDLASRTKKRRI